MSKIVFAAIMIATVALYAIVLRFPPEFVVQTGIGVGMMIVGAVAALKSKRLPFVVASIGIAGLGASLIAGNVEALGLSLFSLSLRWGAMPLLFAWAVFLAWKEEKEEKGGE